MTTQLLYLDDFGVMSCDARVKRANLTNDGRFDVQLDATCFYPRGGGQDWDTGAIVGQEGAIFKVEEVRLDELGVIHHIGSYQFGQLAVDESVRGVVNGGRRKINTWLHSAGHVIDMVVDQLGLPWVPARAAHYPYMCFVEYQGAVPANGADTTRKSIERAANDIIAKGGASIRGIFDRPCGTHVRDASILKCIDITKLKATKGVLKVLYSVGGDPPFRDRADAGRQLAERLVAYKSADVVVYALPRGGVVVGAEVAKRLGVPLELIVTRKIGHPADPEGAIGAIDESGEVLWGKKTKIKLNQAWLDQAVQRERAEVTRRVAVYLGKRQRPPATGKTAIIVDDGAATGLTIIAAIKKLLDEQPKQIIIALPIVREDAIAALKKYSSKIICLYAKTYKDFAFIGVNYQKFHNTTDDEVLQAIKDRP